MHVAIAIVGFRNAGDVAACMGALGASTHTNFEVVVCENGGPEAFKALTAVLPSRLPGGQPVAAVEAPGNIGFAAGVNLAMARAPTADAWWVLNPDTLPEPGALAALVRRLEAGDCDAVGCTLYYPDHRVQSHGGLWQPALGRAVSIGKGSRLEDRIDPAAVERTQSYLNGASMLVGRRFLQTAGPMREDYFLYCEEVEWCLRAQQRGLRLGYAADARVQHESGATTGAGRSFRDMPKTPVFLNERNRILLTTDTWPMLTPLVVVTALGVMLARYGRRGAWRQLGYAFGGWLAGLAGRRGPPAWIQG